MGKSKNIKILVVDDQKDMQKIVQSSLKMLGYANIVAANNGRAALDVLDNQRIDLIICDWNMPVMTGIEFLEKVRAQDKYKGTPFLMLTTEGYKENVFLAIEKGVTDYLVKPLVPAVLEKKLNEILGLTDENSTQKNPLLQ